MRQYIPMYFNLCRGPACLTFHVDCSQIRYIVGNAIHVELVFFLAHVPCSAGKFPVIYKFFISLNLFVFKQKTQLIFVVHNKWIVHVSQ